MRLAGEVNFKGMLSCKNDVAKLMSASKADKVGKAW